MSRCFISYRHVSPDQELAHAIAASLTANGHSVFLDTRIDLGARWVDQIGNELQAAEFFVVLLSEQSIRSDMVRQEVGLAYQLSASGKLSILPVRVAYSGALPYDLAAYLNPLQYTLWNASEPFARVCAEIDSALSQRPAPVSTAPATPPPAALRFPAEDLDRLVKELAVYVGPVAGVLVNRKAQKSHTWKQLYDSLAEEVPLGEERRRFLAKRPLR